MAEQTPAEQLRAAVTELRRIAGSGVDWPWVRHISPTLAKPLAELLEHLGDDMSDYDAEEVDYLGPDDVEVAVVVDDDERIRPDWTAALAVTRALLGGDRD